jgi:hypothetical protein
MGCTESGLALAALWAWSDLDQPDLRRAARYSVLAECCPNLARIRYDDPAVVALYDAVDAQLRAQVRATGPKPAPGLFAEHFGRLPALLAGVEA